MTQSNFNPPHKIQCPLCGWEQLFRSGNSSSRYCEHCNYPIEIVAPGEALQKLIEGTMRAPLQADPAYKAKLSNNLRTWLARGIAAVQAGEMNEAYGYLIKVLSTSWDDADRVEAWIWLSRAVAGVEERKYCLEQAVMIDPAHGYALKNLAIINGRLNPDEIVDPEILAQNPNDDPIETAAEHFVCPQCASPMSYHSTEQVILCEYCHYQESIDNNSQLLKNGRFGEGAHEQEFIIALATAKGHLSPVQMRTFQCQSCAVDFVLSPETISITCPYCQSVYVTQTAESCEIIPPHALIPFQFDEGQARKILQSWFKKHQIKRPKILFVLGIYLPVWTFDIGGRVKRTRRNNSDLLGIGFFESPYFQEKSVPLPHHKPQVKRFDSKPEILSGMDLIFYDDVAVPASKNLSRMMKQFTEYDFSELIDFDSRYLADWPAERYQVSLSAASLQARKKVVKDIRKNAYKFTQTSILGEVKLSPSLVIESYKQILLPLWIAHYRINNQEYEVTINGQTGSVHGRKPQGRIERFLSNLLGRK